MVKRQGSPSVATPPKRKETRAFPDDSIISAPSGSVDSGSLSLPKDTGSSIPGTPTATEGTAENATSGAKHTQSGGNATQPNSDTREPSCGSRVAITDHLSQSGSSAVASSQPQDAFPVFVKGNVIIKTGLDSSPTTQLHGTILATYSSWFKEVFGSARSHGKQPKRFLFTIVEDDDKVNLVLQRDNGGHPEESIGNNSQTVQEHTVKEVGSSNEGSLVKLTTSTPLNCKGLMRKAYLQVLGAFYGVIPDFTVGSIRDTLRESEAVIEIAASLGCLHVVRGHISLAFSQYHRRLFVSIGCDPVRWMLLALKLQDRSIFAEALVHLVGTAPCTPKSWATKREALPEEIRNLIQKRCQELNFERIKVERSLILLSIPYGSLVAPLDPADKAQTETWTLVQVVRDQLAQRIDQYEIADLGPLHYGAFFRGLYRGTLPYLEVDKVRAKCKQTMSGPYPELGKDLETLKKYVSMIAASMAINRLMIDADMYKVGYLTCIEVSDADVPWLAVKEERN